MRSIVAVLAVAVLQAGAWTSSERGVELRAAGDTLHIANTAQDGADLWQEGAPPLHAPYAVRVTFHKLDGRQHEGYGILFGARGLGTAGAQYSYVMIRGDGAVLVKKRDGASLPVVRDWHMVPAVRQDDAHHSALNTLEVRVTAAQVIVMVNGGVVERVPAGELFTSGAAGLRVSHQMRLDAVGYTIVRTAAN